MISRLIKGSIKNALTFAHWQLGLLLAAAETGLRFGSVRDASLYRPFFSPWALAEWRRRLRADDRVSVVSLDRRYVLWQMATQAIRTIEGDVMECGVYRGGTAYLLATIATAEGGSKVVHLFDTFAGMPETRPDHDLHRAGDFGDTSLEQVRQYLADYENVRYHPGFIPDTFDGLADARFCFAHIDLDIYDAILAATAFVYSRIPRGGILLYDDYGFPTCPGARQAVDEFFSDRKECPLVLSTGQCLVVKS